MYKLGSSRHTIVGEATEAMGKKERKEKKYHR
jgi:hypothetical protein